MKVGKKIARSRWVTRPGSTSFAVSLASPRMIMMMNHQKSRKSGVVACSAAGPIDLVYEHRLPSSRRIDPCGKPRAIAAHLSSMHLQKVYAENAGIYARAYVTDLHSVMRAVLTAV